MQHFATKARKVSTQSTGQGPHTDKALRAKVPPVARDKLLDQACIL